MERNESPEINPCIFEQLIHSKGAKNTGERIVSSINDVDKSGEPYAE